MPIYFWTPPTTPICLKCLKSLKFRPSWLSGEKNHLKVGVYRENFNIGNVAQNFFMDFYICWQYVILFSAKFPMLKFSPLAPPPVRWVFRNLTKKWKWSVLRRKKNFPVNFKKRHESLGTILYLFLKKNNFFNFFSIFYDFLKKIHVFFWKNYISL